MSFFDSLFGDKQTKESTSTQSGDQSYGLSPDVMNYWKSISGMYGPDAWKNVDPNQYQQQAIEAGAGYASGLNPAVAGAMGIGANGFDPNSIARFQSPYTQQVVDATQRDFDTQNARQNAGVNANAAKLGALSGTQPLVARNLAQESQRRQQDPIIANLRNQGFNTALGAAKDSLNSQLAGYGAAGSLTGTQAGITNQSFGQGSQLWNQAWQNAGMPYQINQQGAQTLSGLAGSSGQHTSGTATGTETSTASPSPFSTILGGIGAAAKIYGMMPSDERVKRDVTEVGKTHSGQTIYKYRIGDGPFQLGLMAQEVEKDHPNAVGSISGLKMVDYDKATENAERGRKADGGAVGGNDPHQRLASAFEAVHGMLHKARGGSVLRPRFGTGGDVALNDWSAGTTVMPASSFDFGKAGDELTGLSKKMQRPSSQGGGDMLGSQQRSLSQMLSGMGGARPGFADGGFAGEWGENGPIFDDKPGEVSGLGAPMFVGSGVSRSELPPPREGGGLELARITAPSGAAFSVAKPHADRFGAFLSDLEAAGYGVKGDQSGGYNHRNIAGTNKLSNHAHGSAIDINWSDNPVGSTGTIPAELARTLAAKHGMKWGGDFKSNPDPMHFEVASAPGGSSGLAPIARASSEGAVVPTSSQGTIADAPSEKGWFGNFMDRLSKPRDVNERPSRLENIGTMLMAVKSPRFNAPFEGMAQHAIAQNDARLRERQIDADLARMLGELTGKDGKKMPTLDAQRLALAAQEAAGLVKIGDKLTPTIAAQTLKETQRQHDKPTYGVIGQDQYGQPQYGLIDVNKALPPRDGAPAVPSGGAPASGDPGRPPVVPAQGAGAVVTPGPITQNRGDTKLTGEAFLATLNPEDALRVKNIAEGKEAYPSGFAAKSGRGAFLSQAVVQYDPSFDAVNFQARQKARNDFTSGKSAENLKKLNTAIGHLGTMAETLDKLGNTNYPWMNQIRGGYLRSTGDTNYQNTRAKFETAKEGVAGELTAVFRGTGSSTTEIEAWKHKLDAANTPGELKEAVKTATEMLHSRLEAVGHQYQQGFGTTKDPVTLLSPYAQKTWTKLTGEAPPTDLKHSGDKKAETEARPASVPEGARKAADGNWYVPDPNRLGKYLKVNP